MYSFIRFESSITFQVGIFSFFCCYLGLKTKASDFFFLDCIISTPSYQKKNSFSCFLFCNAYVAKGTLTQNYDIMKKSARLWSYYYLSYNIDFCIIF